MWGKCVKQTAGILRWMDRVHLLGHSEVGRVGKNTNPKKSGRIQISAEVDQFKGRKGGEGRERQNWILQKHFFLSLKALATEEGGENVWGLAARLLRSLGMHGVCWRRSTLHIVHYSLHIEHCTMHIALERPLSGLRLACWPDFETWCTSLELYNLSTSLRDPLFCNLFTLWGAECSGAQDAPCSPESWDEWVWFRPGLCLDWLRLVWSHQNGLLYKFCTTNCSLVWSHIIMINIPKGGLRSCKICHPHI